MFDTTEPTKAFLDVQGHRMAYTEAGDPNGAPIVFLHGNPASSYLWRNVWPYVQDIGRIIVPDLIGMGDSDKLENSGPDRYRFVEHRKFLDELLVALGVRENVTLVIHDWGSALGFDWARRHPSAIAGICYMEGIVRPLQWSEWSPAATPVFQGFRSDAGEAMVLEKNIFVEKVLPGSVLRGLTEAEMAVYRRPFAEPGEDRRPTLTWPREIPIEGTPEDVVQIVQDYADWIKDTAFPKLFINAEPGAILIGTQREFCRTWLNQKEVTVKGSHFIQEDSPYEIGTTLAEWMNAR